MNFKNDFLSYFDELHIDYFADGNFIFCNKSDYCFKLVNIAEISIHAPSNSHKLLSINTKTVVLYEDLWNSKNEIVKNRIKAILLPEKSEFARKCMVKNITADISSLFLNKNHLLGNTLAKYKYGLYYKDTLVAVATFSNPRPINRGGKIVNSYEWVRYASIGSMRVAGAMGKLLKHFEDEVDPNEIMTYADKDWSIGSSYLKLGFHKIGETKPIGFYINKNTFERYSLAKSISNIKDLTPEKGWVFLSNNGNLKFIRSRV